MLASTPLLLITRLELDHCATTADNQTLCMGTKEGLWGQQGTMVSILA